MLKMKASQVSVITELFRNNLQSISPKCSVIHTIRPFPTPKTKMYCITPGTIKPLRLFGTPIDIAYLPESRQGCSILLGKNPPQKKPQRENTNMLEIARASSFGTNRNGQPPETHALQSPSSGDLRHSFKF